MSDTKAVEEFLGDLVAVLRKHWCGYLEIKNVWIGGLSHEVRYDAGPSFEILEYKQIGKAVEIDCKERWK